MNSEHALDGCDSKQVGMGFKYIIESPTQLAKSLSLVLIKMPLALLDANETDCLIQTKN